MSAADNASGYGMPNDQSYPIGAPAKSSHRLIIRSTLACWLCEGIVGRQMADFDLNAPAILHWIAREVPLERRLNSLKDAARVAMTELKRGEFFSARIACLDHVFSGDEIVEIFQTGRLSVRGYARF